jgi:hypothetical protein
MSPVGSLDSVSAAGRHVTLSGWASDPDEPDQAVQVHVYVNGQGVAVLSAGQSANGGHGYSSDLTLPVGAQEICTYAINVGEGSSNTHLGCRTVQVSMNPVGALTAVIPEGARARVQGWAVDPDVPAAAVTVHVYLDGRPVTADAAGGTRDGVDGPHAYDVVIPLGSPGTHSLCAYAINMGEGTTNPHLGCRSVTASAADFDPIGELDPVAIDGPVVTVSGWAGDPDATSPLQIHVYVDGIGTAVLFADGASANADQGHMFEAALKLAAGRHSVCVYAINQGSGTTNRHLGCVPVDIPDEAYDPVGALSSVTAAAGRVTVSGWAVDPDDEEAPVTVHVYVDGSGAAITSADQTAADVEGPHAYRTELTMAPGQHRVCTYAINMGVGTTNPHLGCASVTV